jgi:hypothetical protein
VAVRIEEVETWREMEGGGQRLVTTGRWEAGAREADTTRCSPAAVEMLVWKCGPWRSDATKWANGTRPLRARRQ